MRFELRLTGQYRDINVAYLKFSIDKNEIVLYSCNYEAISMNEHDMNIEHRQKKPQNSSVR